eukprot:g38435.t1
MLMSVEDMPLAASRRKYDEEGKRNRETKGTLPARMSKNLAYVLLLTVSLLYGVMGEEATSTSAPASTTAAAGITAGVLEKLNLTNNPKANMKKPFADVTAPPHTHHNVTNTTSPNSYAAMFTALANNDETRMMTIWFGVSVTLVMILSVALIIPEYNFYVKTSARGPAVKLLPGMKVAARRPGPAAYGAIQSRRLHCSTYVETSAALKSQLSVTAQTNDDQVSHKLTVSVALASESLSSAIVVFKYHANLSLLVERLSEQALRC